MAASCAASEPTYAKARPSVGASRYETATIAPGCSVSGSTSQQHPAESQQPACRAAGSYCYLPTAHLRRVRHTEAKVDRHIAEDAKHADASVLQLRLRADTHASGQVDAASSSRPVGGRGGWAHLARPTEGHSVGEEQRVEALVARQGAVKRGGRVQEGNRLGLLLPGDRVGLREACGASALLLPRRTARAFQRLTDLHDDGAAASAALQAGGLVRHSRVSDESQHC